MGIAALGKSVMYPKKKTEPAFYPIYIWKKIEMLNVKT